MIKAAPCPHPQVEVSERRLASLFDRHYDLIWRSLRRFGVASDEVDDAAQEVFIVAARRLMDIEVGKERAFLFSTAVRVASDSRRARARRSRPLDGDASLFEVEDPNPGADVLTDHKHARQLLDGVLEGMADEQRVVFALFELEGMTMAAIAESLDLKPGTVASRLRRAREHYARQVDRLRAERQRIEAER